MKPINPSSVSPTTRKVAAVLLTSLVAGMAAQASTDYGPAIWRPACDGKWYTTGYGHKFCVLHDMEGYYAYEVSPNSGLRGCGTGVSCHYAVNGKKDATSDYPAGEVTQFVRDAYYPWHARCWNQHSTGVEHEGFRSNPAWFTTEMYDATAALHVNLCNKFGIPKDRNHLVGHDEKSRSAWVSYANANLGVNATCNTHNDPGPYWDWTRLMNLINPPPPTGVTVDNSNAGFSVTGTWATGSSSTDKYGADYRYHSTAAVSEPAQWLAGVSGTKTVSAWWAQGSNRSATAAYHVYHSGGTTVVNVNQQANGGKWNSLGSFSMTTGKVLLSVWTATGYIVVADAIKWQ